FLIISVLFLLTAQLINIIPITNPDSRPTVARPIDRSYASGKPNFSNVPASPAAEPCPPSKEISISATAIGGRPKNGVLTNNASKTPTTYCPQPIAHPKEI